MQVGAGAEMGVPAGGWEKVPWCRGWPDVGCSPDEGPLHVRPSTGRLRPVPQHTDPGIRLVTIRLTPSHHSAQWLHTRWETKPRLTPKISLEHEIDSYDHIGNQDLLLPI